MIASRTLRAVLLSAVLALPTLAEAQPYTMLVTFTQPLVDGSDPDTHVDNPIVPIAPPTEPGTYGLVTYVARGGPGVGVITEPGYVAAASVRLYFNADQMEAPTAPGGVPSNLLSLGNGAAPRSVILPHGSPSAVADQANADVNEGTTHFVTVTVAMPTADPGTLLYSNNDPSAERFRLPIGWSSDTTSAAQGTFEPFITTNVVVKPTATFPLQIGTTPNPASGNFTSRRLSDNSVGSAQVYCFVAKPGQLGPIPTPTPIVPPRVSAAGLSVQVESLESAPSFVAYYVQFGNNFAYQGDTGWMSSDDYDVTFPNWPYSRLPLRLQAFGGDPQGGVAGIYPIGSTTLNGTVARGEQ